MATRPQNKVKKKAKKPSYTLQVRVWMKDRMWIVGVTDKEGDLVCIDLSRARRLFVSWYNKHLKTYPRCIATAHSFTNGKIGDDGWISGSNDAIEMMVQVLPG